MKEIQLSSLSFNPFLKIRDQYALIACGNENDFNMMTVSWGCMGELWFKEVTNIFVRKSRLTYEYLEKNDLYSLIFLKDGYEKELKFLGSNSGRDVNKMNYSSLTPCLTKQGVITFKEAELTFVCKKLYSCDIKEQNFLDKTIFPKCYASGDIHKMYIGEIISVYSE